MTSFCFLVLVKIYFRDHSFFLSVPDMCLFDFSRNQHVRRTAWPALPLLSARHATQASHLTSPASALVSVMRSVLALLILVSIVVSYNAPGCWTEVSYIYIGIWDEEWIKVRRRKKDSPAVQWGEGNHNYLINPLMPELFLTIFLFLAIPFLEKLAAVAWLTYLGVHRHNYINYYIYIRYRYI